MEVDHFEAHPALFAHLRLQVLRLSQIHLHPGTYTAPVSGSQIPRGPLAAATEAPN